MKFDNRFRIGWWLAITVGAGFVLAPRYSAFAIGKSSAIDALVFVSWAALLLVPVFTEFSFGSFKFKQEVEALKADLTSKITELRNDVRAEVRANVSPTFHFNPAPVPDAALSDLKREADAVLSSYGVVPRTSAAEAAPAAPPGVTTLFEARYALEVELRRIAKERELARDRAPSMQIMRAMKAAGLIDDRMEHVLREVYLICSPAIHGEPVTSAQVSFVSDVLPEMLAALQRIR